MAAKFGTQCAKRKWHAKTWNFVITRDGTTVVKTKALSNRFAASGWGDAHDVRSLPQTKKRLLALVGIAAHWFAAKKLGLQTAASAL